jgi:hypothetical protein
VSSATYHSALTCMARMQGVAANVAWFFSITDDACVVQVCMTSCVGMPEVHMPLRCSVLCFKYIEEMKRGGTLGPPKN